MIQIITYKKLSTFYATMSVLGNTGKPTGRINQVYFNYYKISTDSYTARPLSVVQK